MVAQGRTRQVIRLNVITKLVIVNENNLNTLFKQTLDEGNILSVWDMMRNDSIPDSRCLAEESKQKVVPESIIWQIFTYTG